MNKDFYTAYKVIKQVYSDKAYINIAMQNLPSDSITPLVTKLIYGVVERDIELNYYIEKFADKKPSQKASALIKLGIYAIKYLDGIPHYAVVNECVQMCDDVLKAVALKPFVNAVLNSVIEKEITLPTNKYQKLSVIYSKPEWLVRAAYKQFGDKLGEEILSLNTIEGLEHARANKAMTTSKELEKLFLNNDIAYTNSEYGGYYIKNCAKTRELFDKGLLTFQSPSSMLAIQALGDCSGLSVLDMCSAPGGKAVYLAENSPNVQITACDIYPHRIDLIEGYAKRMQTTGITTCLCDATQLNNDFVAKYDVVMCDAPCSGLGVMHKKPDILLGIEYDDITSLARLQYDIINNAIEYCKLGGRILYSTCTIMREENYNIIGRVIKEHEDVELVPLAINGGENGCIQLLPTQELDGFFIAMLKKKR